MGLVIDYIPIYLLYSDIHCSPVLLMSDTGSVLYEGDTFHTPGYAEYANGYVEGISTNSAISRKLIPIDYENEVIPEEVMKILPEDQKDRLEDYLNY